MRTTKHLFGLLILIMLISQSISASAQETLTQTIRGQVTDIDTRSPLPGATVVVVGSNPMIAAATDFDGYYVLEKVPVGKVDLLIRFLGYEEMVIPNVNVVSGKETLLSINLQESFEMLNTVEVTPDESRSEDMTEMTMISATTFNMEESERSPGSFNDPSRIASIFAGVTTSPYGNNDIIVRGNSPKGIQWRLDGIEIPNPNHFADEGMTGGAINILNSDMLTNSSFYTGAFAPEYGNAFSGIMDLELRTGNNAKREYSITGGVLGIEASAEGPFVKGKRSSYLFNYRYSTLSLLDKINLVDYGGVPEYQDGFFKFHLPTQNAGIFTVFGLGGYSHIFEEYEDTLGRLEDRFLFDSYMGVLGIKHAYPLSTKTYISTDLSMSINGNLNDGEELSEDGDVFYTYYEDKMRKMTNAINTSITHKFNSRHVLKGGAGVRMYQYDYNSAWTEDEEIDLTTFIDEKGNATMLNAYLSWKYRATANLTMVSGVHYQHFLLNNTYTIEPRASVHWQFHENQALFGGFGLHSKLEPLPTYLSKPQDGTVVTQLPNKDLEFPKSAHFIVGYESRIAPNVNFKIEAYYQHLYDIPVENDPNSYVSALNLDGGFFDYYDFVNNGTGKNYGIELTLDRYFVNQYFFTFTASLYNSKYTALDDIERNTRFNGNLSLNLIGGKEFYIGKDEKHRTLGLNGRLTWGGGPRYTPVLLDQSILEDETVLDENNRYSERTIGFYKLNLTLYYTRNLKRVSHTFKMEVENATNHQAKLIEYYDSGTQNLEYASQMEILPVVRWTLNW